MRRLIAVLALILAPAYLQAKGSSGGHSSSHSYSHSYSHSNSEGHSSLGSSSKTHVNTTSHSEGERWTTPSGRVVVGQPKLYNGTPMKGFKASTKKSQESVSRPAVVVVHHEDTGSTFFSFRYWWLPWNIWHPRSSANPVATPTPGSK